MYFLDPEAVSPLRFAVLGIIMVSGYLVSLVLGFQLARFLIWRGKPGMVMIILAGVIIALGIFSLLTLDRLLWVGDYQAWTKGVNMTLIFKHRLSALITLMALTGFGALAVMLRKLKN